eukprot:403333145
MNENNNGMEVDESHQKVKLFPSNISNQSNRTKHNIQDDIIFRNYTPFDQQSFPNRENMEQFKQVAKLEQMYAKKVKKQIRDYVKSEENPINGMLPKMANIDLKRNLQTKMDRLSIMTERSILEILKDQVLVNGGKGQNDGQ